MKIDDFKITKPNDDHHHKWYMAQMKAEFQQINPGTTSLFRKVEYAFLVCNCAQVKKVLVSEDDAEPIRT